MNGRQHNLAFSSWATMKFNAKTNVSSYFTRNSDGTGSHDELELNFLGLGVAEAEINVGEVFLAQSQGSYGMTLFFITEVGRVNLDHVALA